jgi:hypothetical protein
MATNAVLSFAILLWIDLNRIRNNESAASPQLVLLNNSLSPVLGWECQCSFLIPIFYAGFPPTSPDRRTMMQQDSEGI